LKRSVSDVLRRGFESTIANWPVILLRIAEVVVFAGVILGGIVAAVVPAIVAAGLSKDEIMNSADPAGAVVEWMIGHLALFGWMFALAFVVLGVLMAIHAFVQGGAVQIYVDAERTASRRGAAGRGDFDAFSIDRWLAGGAGSWWRIFWLYNLAWSVGLLFVLVPLAFTLVAMLVVGDGAGKIIVGCAGLVIALLVFIPVYVVTSIWCTKAITICVARSLPATESLRIGWRAIRTDLGRHLAIAVIVFVVSLALNSLVSGLSFPMSFTSQKLPSVALLFAPVQMFGGVVQGVFSAAIGSLLLACFVSMTEER
jgi:hypothetical protein